LTLFRVNITYEITLSLGLKQNQINITHIFTKKKDLCGNSDQSSKWIMTCLIMLLMNMHNGSKR
jgi:hypothetical protein